LHPNSPFLNTTFQGKYSVSTPSSPVLACSHGIGMLCSPKQANMGQCPKIYNANPNIYFSSWVLNKSACFFYFPFQTGARPCDGNRFKI